MAVIAFPLRYPLALAASFTAPCYAFMWGVAST